MKNRYTSAVPRLLVALSLIMALWSLGVSAVPQEDEHRLRKIWVDLQGQRPGSQKRKSSQPKTTAARPEYKRVTPALPPLKPIKTAKGRKPPAGRYDPARRVRDRSIGITVWRLRPAVPDDRTFIHDKATSGGREGWTPVRIGIGTPLAEGDRVRIGIESPEPGYLYVINREEYANGSRGEPVLIFPTKRTHGGVNRVKAGRLIELPAQQDDVPYFTIRPSRRRPDQVGELLTIIVTKRPLDLNIGYDPLRLAEEQVLEWEHQWKGLWELIEQTGGEGTFWTQAEQEAGLSPSRELVQDDPLPQAIYRVRTKDDAPLLVSVSLPFGGTGGRR